MLKLLTNVPADQNEIIFKAADGYSPRISRSKINEHHAYVAYQEHGRSKSEGRFEKIRDGNARISPEPFYLIWQDYEKPSRDFPSPYRLIKIEFTSLKERYAKTFPATAADSKEMRGFYLFNKDCIHCHSLNGIGGNLGPELNIPTNVMEYWDEKNLRSFIRSVSSFRPRDKMPDFPQLSSSDLDDVVSYFLYLKEYQ